MKRCWALRVTLVAAIAMLIAVVPTRAAPPAPPTVFPYGVSWYPEQEDEAGWDADLARMRTANINFVRMGEFAWSRIEPREGVYDFGWLDRAIALAKAHGIKVLLGTPTAAPPAWLTTKYPEVLLIDASGQRAKRGGRRHFSVRSALYRQKAAAIAAEMARRYGRDTSVIGFQIDNEYGRDTRDAETRAAFQQWLRAKYADVARMNSAWFATYWSQTYDDWSQVNIPGPGDNPGLTLDWQRFWSEYWRDYQQNQIAAMRPYLAPDKIITTNFVAQYDNFDYSVPAQKLDVVGWDWYFEGKDLDPAEGGMLHDLYRGFLGRNPWILEAAAGNIVYVDRNFTQAKGVNRAMVWQAVGHGADAYAFWVLQPPLNGSEPFHGSLVDVAGRPRPVFAEIAQAGAEVAKVWPALRGTTPVAEVAMLHDYPSRWALKRLPMTKDYDPWRVFVAWHRAFSPNVAGIDVLRGSDGLDKYRMVIASALHILEPATASRLIAYVRHGGHLVLGPRSGVKDGSSSLWTMGQPGPLAALLGAHIDQTEVIVKPVALEGRLGAMAATVWAERFAADAPGLETIVSYGKSGDWLGGTAAVVSRKVGKGRITYVGALIDDDGMARIAKWTADTAGAKPLWPGVPNGVEVIARSGPMGRTYVAINWSDVPQTVRLPAAMKNLLSGNRVAAVTLDHYGIAVVAP